MNEPPVAAPQKAGKKRVGKRRVLFNGFANWVGFAAQVAVTFVTAPIIVHSLGDLRYGIWSLVESVLAYLVLFDLGLTASVVRFTAKYDAIDDHENRDRILSTSIALFAAIGIVAFLVACVLALFAPAIFRIPPEVAVEGQWLFLLLGINLAIGLPMNVFPGILAGLNRYPATTAIRTGFLILRAGSMVILVLNGGKLIEIGLLFTGVSLLEHFAFFLAVRHFMPDYRFSLSQINRETFRNIKGYSIFAFIIAVNHRISFKTDPIVIAAFLGPQAITPFIIGKRLVGHATSSLRAVTQVLTPAVSALDAQGKTRAIRKLMLDGTRYVLWLIIPLQLGLMILGKQFLVLWMGPRLADLSYMTLLILAAPLALSLSQSISTRILFGTSGLRWLAFAGIVHSLANILLSILLVTSLGIEGVAIGTAVPYIIFNLAVEKHVCRKLGIGFGEFFTSVYVKPLLLAPMLGAAWFTAARLLEPSWVQLAATVAIGLAVYGFAALWLEFGLSRVWSFAVGNGRHVIAKLSRRAKSASKP